MNNFRLNPCDILVNVNDRNDPFSRVTRFIAGPFDHVFMYLGKVRLIVDPKQNVTLRFPLLFESNGRGAVIQALSNRYGQPVIVMRLKSEYQGKIPRVLKEAVKLASEEKARYDYWCILEFCIPRLLCQKLGIPLALRYSKDEFQICSEAVNEVYHRARVALLPQDVVPLPGDFVTDSLLLEKVWAGRLSEELV